MPLDGRGSFQDTSGCNGSLNAEDLFGAISVFCERVTKATDIDALPAPSRRPDPAAPRCCCCPRTFNRRLITRPEQHRNGYQPAQRQVGNPHPLAQALRSLWAGHDRRGRASRSRRRREG